MMTGESSPLDEAEVGVIRKAYIISLGKLTITHVVDDTVRRKLYETILKVFFSRDIAYRETSVEEIEALAEKGRIRLLSTIGSASIKH